MPFWERVWQVLDRTTEAALDRLPRIFAALIMIFIAFVMARVVRKAIRVAMERTKAEPHIRVLVSQSGYIGVWVVGWAGALALLDINLSGLIAGLGFTGAVLSFAVRDIIANMVSGIVLMSTRPFKIGDTLALEGFEGTVEAIEIRATTLKTADGKQVLIPNTKVFAANITNFSTYPVRRFSFMVRVAPHHKSETVGSVLADELKAIPEVLDDPAPTVRLQEFSGEFVTFEIGYWLDTGKVAPLDVQMGVKERLRNRLLAERMPPA